MFKNFFAPLQQLKSEEKKSILFTAICFFFVLFSYPLLRSTTTSLFLQAFGAKNSPVVWLFSIIVLSGVVTLFSKIQLKLKIHSLFLWTSIFSLVFFGVFTFLFSLDLSWAAYGLFIWKEIYIVLQVHLLFAFLTSSIQLETAKILYGPFAALGSLGGVLGGILTSNLNEGSLYSRDPYGWNHSGGPCRFILFENG